MTALTEPERCGALGKPCPDPAVCAWLTPWSKESDRMLLCDRHRAMLVIAEPLAEIVPLEVRR
jgi:hypothetical protein